MSQSEQNHVVLVFINTRRTVRPRRKYTVLDGHFFGHGALRSMGWPVLLLEDTDVLLVKTPNEYEPGRKPWRLFRLFPEVVEHGEFFDSRVAMWAAIRLSQTTPT